MPYATGIANNATDLRTAVVNLATANGWTWDSTNEMLYKAPVYGKFTVSGTALRIQGALAYSGGVLTSPGPGPSSMGVSFTATGNTAITYPLTYHVFLDATPDAIVVAINYGAVWWQWLGFGNAIPKGAVTNPLWYFATTGTNNVGGVTGVVVYVRGWQGAASGQTSGIPFWPSYTAANGSQTGAIYTGGLDGGGSNGWSIGPSSQTTENTLSTAALVPTASGLLTTQPNAWNAETLLVPVNPVISRPSGFKSYIGEVSCIRLTRNDFFEDGDILTIGTQKWFIAPVYRKNASSRDGADYLSPNHSGTLAYAIKYDGP